MAAAVLKRKTAMPVRLLALACACLMPLAAAAAVSSMLSSQGDESVPMLITTAPLMAATPPSSQARGIWAMVSGWRRGSPA